MVRLGEGILMVGSYRVGEFWVGQLFAEPALSPRLKLQMGCLLGELPKEYVHRTYYLTDVSGQLRFSDRDGPVVGNLIRNGNLSGFGSSAVVGGFPHQFSMNCDLDFRCIDQIQKARGNNPPVFWVELWPSLDNRFGGVGPFEPLRASIDPFRIEVGIEDWIEFLRQIQFGEFEVLEIAKPKGVSEGFHDAIGHIGDARDCILRGEWNEAVRLCRLIIEALSKELGQGSDAEVFKALMIAGSDEKRGQEYYGILSRVKQLAAMKSHDFGANIDFSRIEALFILRTTENLLSLIGYMASRQS